MTVIDKYENYRRAALEGGAPSADVELAIAAMKAEDAKIDAGICPRCGGFISKALDPRQAGATEIAGKWFNYRCISRCGWFVDRCEPVGEN